MGSNVKLLVLQPKERSRDQRLELRTDRKRALTAIAASGAKVRHDSGGRLIAIEVTDETAKVVAERLSDARIVPLDANVRDTIPDLDATEALFLEALRIRTSQRYRDAKARRVVGETREEQELISGPDVREEY